MADKPQTNAEALAKIIEQEDALRVKLNKAISSNDKKAEADILDQMYALDAKKRSVSSTVGALGSGLQSGIKSAITAPLDIGMMVRNLLTGEQNKLPSDYVSEGIRGLFSKYMGTTSGEWGVNEPQSQESAIPFRAGQAFGASATPGTGAKMLATQTAVGAADAALGDTGMLSLGFGLGQLGLGGFQALKNMRDSRKMKAFVEGLPIDEGNAFKQFMMTGQGSDSPLANAAFQKLSQDTKYSELFATLRKGATEAATANIAPKVSPLTEGQATTASITGISAKLEGLRQQMKTAGGPAFERAYGYAGDRNIVDYENTMSRIKSLRQEFGTKGSPDSEKAATLLQNVEEKLNATGQRMTVPQVQGWLSEFGAKASNEGALFGDLSIQAQDRIMKTVFGGLKDDLRASLGKVSDSNDIVAIKALIEARNKTAEAATKYNDLVAQGMPKFLKDKPLNAISPEDFHSEYLKLNSGQRQIVRSFLEGTDSEALQFTDRKIWDDFVSSARSANPDGSKGTNLEKLAKNWFNLKPNEKDALTTALGTNAADFEKRMKDAEVFTRKMNIGQPSAADIIPNRNVADIEAVVGASPAGYSGAKTARTVLQTVNTFGEKVFGGLSDDQLMKVLLTKEGKDFLSKAKLTGASQKTLDELNKVTNAAVPAARGATLIYATQQPAQTETPPSMPELKLLPEDAQQGGEGSLPPLQLLPEDIQ